MFFSFEALRKCLLFYIPNVWANKTKWNTFHTETVTHDFARMLIMTFPSRIINLGHIQPVPLNEKTARIRLWLIMLLFSYTLYCRQNYVYWTGREASLEEDKECTKREYHVGRSIILLMLWTDGDWSQPI